MKTYDICIVGGGAAGLCAAIIARREGATVLVLEQMDQAGKKILATGNGKCNLTNTSIRRSAIPGDAYRCGRRDFVRKVIEAFDAEDTVKLFESMALYTKDKAGYVYPKSEQASTVRDVLILEAGELGVEISTGCKVVDVTNCDGSFIIKGESFIKSDNTTASKKFYKYAARNIIMACGGKSGRGLGDTESGYSICKRFGHRIVKTVPALCGLVCKEKFFKLVSGVRAQAGVKLIVDGDIVASDRGEVQLTEYGISGIPVFQVSRYAGYALAHNKKVYAELDFMPDMDEDELIRIIREQVKRHPDRHIENILCGLVNKKLAACIIKLLKDSDVKSAHTGRDTRSGNIERDTRAGYIGGDTRAGYIGRDTRAGYIEKLAAYIKRLRVEIIRTNGFDQSQVSAGGVDANEIDPLTMESMKMPGLYVVGELVDVDGICGGYNLQWAWSSAVVAARAASRKKLTERICRKEAGKVKLSGDCPEGNRC